MQTFKAVLLLSSEILIYILVKLLFPFSHKIIIFFLLTIKLLATDPVLNAVNMIF